MKLSSNVSGLKQQGLLFIFLVLFCLNINISAQTGNDIKKRFLVDKIYDYHDTLIAEYFYDDSYKLIKKIVHDELVESLRIISRKRVDTFEYKDGRISKIKSYHLYIDNAKWGSDTIENTVVTNYEYDYQGNLILPGRDYIYNNNQLISTNGYEMENCFYRDTLVYDKSSNVIKHIWVRPELNAFGEPIKGTYFADIRDYEYDNNPKPYFGIENLFVYNPYPYINGPDWEISISNNNMTKAINDGYLWYYTYNENGLPATIETKCIGSDSKYPIMLKLNYKQISTDIKPIQKESIGIKIYPNPANNVLYVECETSGILKLYDLFGKLVINQNINNKAEIDVSHLPGGFYNIRLESDGKISGCCKIIKK
jgi:hypothetical protein